MGRSVRCTVIHSATGCINSPSLPLTLSVEPDWTVASLVAACEAQLKSIKISLCFAAARTLSLSERLPAEITEYQVVADVRTEPLCRDVGPPPKSAKIPITVLTGFLGAGKTTLLNHLLHTQRDQKIAVIENEFGAVPIDADLIDQDNKLSAAEQVIVMDNGCMCCSVRGDILGAFSSIFAAVEAGNPLDAVLIETTGMADPVPIVRTLRTTPEIAKSFSLNGVVTLCDAKNLLGRLRELEHDDGGRDAGTVDEAFQQVMFADRIVLNKIDLVDAPTALEAWRRIRAINAKADIVPCVRGQIEAHSLVNVGGFDLAKLAEEEGAAAASSGGHEHDHDMCEHDHMEESNDHSHGHDEAAPSFAFDPTIVHSHDHAAAAHAHNQHVGTFSIVRDNLCVEPLLFARWLRKVASAKVEDIGTLYRSKGVLAVSGVNERLVFHAVADVMEKEYVGKWPATATPGVKLVFIGKKLNREWLTSTFEACLRPWRPYLRAESPPPSRIASIETTVMEVDELMFTQMNISNSNSLLMALLYAERNVFYQTVVGWLSSKEAVKLALSCTTMADALLGAAGGDSLRLAAATIDERHPRPIIVPTTTVKVQEGNAPLAPGFHKKDDPTMDGLRLHGLLPLGAVATYVNAFVDTSAEIIPYPGLTFTDATAAEAAGVTFLELAEVRDKGDKPKPTGAAADEEEGPPAPVEQCYVIDFTWRLETIAAFLSAGPEASTQSALSKIDVYNEEEEEWDSLKFRLMLWPAKKPEEEEAAAAAPAAEEGDGTVPAAGAELVQHRLVLQLVGGKGASRVYMISFHTIDPTFQVHVGVPDHRMPLYESKETFHRYHPLMAALKREGKVRMLVRVKPDGSGPLGDMCGCC